MKKLNGKQAQAQKVQTWFGPICEQFIEAEMKQTRLPRNVVINNLLLEAIETRVELDRNDLSPAEIRYCEAEAIPFAEFLARKEGK